MSTMKKIAVGVASMLAVTVVLAKPGNTGGQTTAVTCSDSAATVGNAGYVQCQGPTVGNLGPGGNSVSQVTFANTVYNWVGKTDDNGFGPFASNPGGAKSGTISFDTAQTGSFVLGIKGGNTYSLYLFNGGTTGISSLKWDTLGITNGGGGAGPGLSHMALFRSTPVTPVPEPETYALMLAGLGAVGFVARRRKST